MNKHYILNINPEAACEWDRCVLRNPITGERPDLKYAISQAVQNKPGSYLIKVCLSVEILEQTVAENSLANVTPIPKSATKFITVNQ